MASVDGSTPAGLADVNVYTAPVPKEDKHRGVLVGTPGDSSSGESHVSIPIHQGRDAEMHFHVKRKVDSY